MKQLGKLALILTAIVAIGMFALPESLSTISGGQHKFYSGNDTACNKCHNSAISGGIQAELYSTTSTTVYGTDVDAAGDAAGDNLGGMPGGYLRNQVIHAAFSCDNCHTPIRGGTSISTTTHVRLSSPTCYGCHAHVSTNNGVTGELAAGTEVHKGLSNDGNAACVGCHTSVGVQGSIGWAAVNGTQAIGTSGLTIKATP